jgi:hypothetical protein
VLQRVREDGDETGIVRRLPGEVGNSFRPGKTEDKEELQGPRPALHLDPAADGSIRREQRAVPQAKLFENQSRVGHFQHDAAYILVCEKIVASELQVVHGARLSKKKGSLRQPAKKR